MTDEITSTDLEDWSRRNDAQHHLPTLIRRLIMATTSPGSIVIPAAEAVRLPGFDGVVEHAAGMPPFIPAGRSVWEMGTSQDPGDKAQRDYRVRTDGTSEAERARTTYVAVTSRLWKEGQDWVERKRTANDGWADVRAIDATQLATWLETCAGPRSWLAEKLGRMPCGRKSLRDYFADWSESTEPTIPTAVLLAGRRQNAADLRAHLLSSAQAVVVATASRDESLAFVAAALLDSEEDDAGARESLVERSLVVDTLPSWRAATSWERPHVLVAALPDPDTHAAIAQGHHVVLLEASSPRDGRLPRIDREEARAAWEAAGVKHPLSDELATAARRSLTSLRRRIGRTGHLRRPPWARRTDATMLAPLLLAVSWRDDVEGDMEVIAALSGREWRALARDLSAIASEDDPPIRVSGRIWEFLDVIDAWDNLRHALTAEDIGTFREQVVRVLGEPDPLYGVDPVDGWRAQTESRYSTSLREGVSVTIAVLGASVGDVELPAGLTGQEEADQLVRQLMTAADAERWFSLAPALPLLAEGAPGQILSAIEAALNEGST